MTINRIIMSFFLLALISVQGRAAGPSRHVLLAAYIFRLAEHIKWPASASHKYHIHLVDDKTQIEDQLIIAAKVKKIHEKEVIISRSSSEKIPAEAQIVFISKNLSGHYREVFNATDSKSILLISNGLNDDRYALIDINEHKQQLHFKINKSNIINRGLKIDPDIIFIGGTEIDVAHLYKEGQNNIKKQTNYLNTLKKKIYLSEQLSSNLSLELTKSEEKILSRNTLIGTQADKISSQQLTLKNLLNKIDLLTDDIDNKSVFLERKEIKLSELQQSISDSINNLSLYKQQLSKYKHEANIQEFEVSRQAELLANQSLSIKKYMFTIENQKQYLLLIALSCFMFFLLMLISFYAYRSKKISNAKLIEYTSFLAAAKKTAEASTKAKSIFLSCMSHELRSPLTSIIGFSQLMKDNLSLPLDTVKENIDIINRSGTHLLTLINDILDISKIESGQVELNNETINLHNLLCDIVNMSRVHSDNKDIELILDIDKTCLEYIHVDSTKLRRLLINLINNAIKFTFEGGVSIRVCTLSTQIVNQIELSVEIKDTGVGIAKDMQEKIFLPFEQVKSTEIEHEWLPGTGLGLNICKQLVSLMDGSIEVTSTPGKGSVFCFTIKVESVNTDELSLITDNKTKITGINPKHPTVRVLIAEDLVESALYLRGILQQIGCNVMIAENGKQAIDAFQTFEPDIILMDRRMPVMDGIAATGKIRSLPNGNQAVIIAVTASSFKEDQMHIMQHGFDDFIRKPYLSEEIYACLHKHLKIDFIYELQNNAEAQHSQYDLDYKELNRIPKDIILELHAAALDLDVDRALVAIDLINARHHHISSNLKMLVNNFKFVQLCNLTQQN